MTFQTVWGLDELLECQRPFFPYAGCSDVQEAFGVVGNLGGAVLDIDQLEVLLGKIMSAARALNLDLI